MLVLFFLEKKNKIDIKREVSTHTMDFFQLIQIFRAWEHARHHWLLVVGTLRLHYLFSTTKSCLMVRLICLLS